MEATKKIREQVSAELRAGNVGKVNDDFISKKVKELGSKELSLKRQELDKQTWELRSAQANTFKINSLYVLSLAGVKTYSGLKAELDEVKGYEETKRQEVQRLQKEVDEMEKSEVERVKKCLLVTMQGKKYEGAHIFSIPKLTSERVLLIRRLYKVEKQAEYIKSIFGEESLEKTDFDKLNEETKNAAEKQITKHFKYDHNPHDLMQTIEEFKKSGGKIEDIKLQIDDIGKYTLKGGGKLNIQDAVVVNIMDAIWNNNSKYETEWRDMANQLGIKDIDAHKITVDSKDGYVSLASKELGPVKVKTGGSIAGVRKNISTRRAKIKARTEARETARRQKQWLQLTQKEVIKLNAFLENAVFIKTSLPIVNEEKRQGKIAMQMLQYYAQKATLGVKNIPFTEDEEKLEQVKDASEYYKKYCVEWVSDLVGAKNVSDFFDGKYKTKADEEGAKEIQDIIKPLPASFFAKEIATLFKELSSGEEPQKRRGPGGG